MSAELSPQQFVESLTGYEEIGITQNFGVNVGTLADTDQILLLRALVFVDQKRNGMKDREAKDAALSMTQKEAADYFPDDPEVMPDEEPVTELGKVEMHSAN